MKLINTAENEDQIQGRMVGGGKEAGKDDSMVVAWRRYVMWGKGWKVSHARL